MDEEVARLGRSTSARNVAMERRPEATARHVRG
jgi:hypothetical protein